MKSLLFFFISMAIFSTVANADYAHKSPVKITSVSAYDDGRIFFKTEPRETSNCGATSAYYGDFYFYSTDSGADLKMSLLLSAIATGKDVGIHYLVNTSSYCKAGIIQLQN